MTAVLIDEDAPTPLRIRGSHEVITRPASKVTDVEGTAWTSETTGVVAFEAITLPRPSIEISSADMPRSISAAPCGAGPRLIDRTIPLFATGPETTHTNALAYDQMLILDRLLSSPPERVGVPRLSRVELAIQRAPTIGKATLSRPGSGLHTAMSVLFALGFAAAVGYLLAVV